jgi:ABC-type transporter Mla MlaB component
MGAARPPPEPSQPSFALEGPIDRSDIRALCDRAFRLLDEGETGPVMCDVGALVDPDAVMIDALARLQLAARRIGRPIRLRHASGELRALLDLMGLSDILPLVETSGLETGGQAEEREQTRGVEEEADSGDPACR